MELNRFNYNIAEFRRIVDFGGWRMGWKSWARFRLSNASPYHRKCRELVKDIDLYGCICWELPDRFQSPIFKVAFEIPYEDLPLHINKYEDYDPPPSTDDICRKIINWRLKNGK